MATNDTTSTSAAAAAAAASTAETERKRKRKKMEYADTVIVNAKTYVVDASLHLGNMKTLNNSLQNHIQYTHSKKHGGNPTHHSLLNHGSFTY
jgi:hypothetical protein